MFTLRTRWTRVHRSLLDWSLIIQWNRLFRLFQTWNPLFPVDRHLPLHNWIACWKKARRSLLSVTGPPAHKKMLCELLKVKVVVGHHRPFRSSYRRLRLQACGSLSLVWIPPWWIWGRFSLLFGGNAGQVLWRLFWGRKSFNRRYEKTIIAFLYGPQIWRWFAIGRASFRHYWLLLDLIKWEDSFAEPQRMIGYRSW